MGSEVRDGLFNLEHDTERLIRMLMKDVATEDVSDLGDFDGADTNVMYACTRLFHDWHFKVFPLLRAKRKSRYAVLAKFLQKNGYENATEPLVRGYFAKIRLRLGIRSEDDVEPSHVPVVVQAQSKAPVAVRGPVNAVTPIVTLPAAHGVGVAVTAPPVSVVSLGGDVHDEAYLVSQMTRLRVHKNDAVQVWTEDDEALFQVTDGILESSYINKNDTDRCIEALDNVNPVYSDIWERLIVKKRILSLSR